MAPFRLPNGSPEGSQWHLDPVSKEWPELIELLFRLGREKYELRIHLGTLLGPMLASKTLHFELVF